MRDRPAWHEQANCRHLTETDADLLFYADEHDLPAIAQARTICNGQEGISPACPVLAECYEAAKAFERGTISAVFGIWAGLTPTERKKLYRKQRANQDADR